VHAAGGLAERVKQEQAKVKDILDNHSSGIAKNAQTFDRLKKQILQRLTDVQTKVNKVFASGCLPC
jgi:hypothetical protein